MIEWSRQGQIQQAQWRSESGAPAPRRVVTADDTLAADTAYRMACEGTGLLWQGDFQNARMLLQALMRRADAKSGKAGKSAKPRKSAAKAAETHLALEEPCKCKEVDGHQGRNTTWRLTTNEQRARVRSARALFVFRLPQFVFFHGTLFFVMC